jgi:hypothetical protein
LELGAHKSSSGDDIDLKMADVVSKLQFYFSNPTDMAELRENIRRWTEFVEWYSLQATAGLDQARLKRSWFHVNTKVDIPGKGKPPRYQIVLFSKAEAKGPKLESIFQAWDYIK